MRIVSDKFVIAIKLNEKPAYQIAQKAGIDPNLLSKIIHGIIEIKPNDDKVIQVGRVLGLEPHECFKDVS